ncbi:MAG: aminoacyl-tRNA hydrolase [Calditrichaeota bacterium]|nr:aminoacyl-tRNA hydrolase [Calditrichota bacterium]
MKALIGLGNPDVKYVGTRHNIGFFILDQLTDPVNFKPSKFDFYFSRIELSGQEILLVKPSTYMNNSGDGIRQLIKSDAGISIDDILIIYDDYHLPLGKLRFRPSGSDGGHNGIKSIIYRLETDQFQRLRFGIGEPDNSLIDYVLSQFTANETDLMRQTVEKSIEAIEFWLNNGITKTMSEYNSLNLNQ